MFTTKNNNYSLEIKKNKDNQIVSVNIRDNNYKIAFIVPYSDMKELLEYLTKEMNNL